jgi:hypothetical protein
LTFVCYSSAIEIPEVNMAFAERYVGALNANLQDDEHHHATSVLCASAIADRSARDIGALLHRIKYNNAFRKEFEGDANALAGLHRAWLTIVTIKGRERHWIKAKDWPTLGHMFPAMAGKIADHSLAYYLDSVCKRCNGTGAKSALEMFRTCPTCGGTREASIDEIPKLSGYERQLVRDMVSELLVLEQTHAGVASSRLRRPA